MADFQFFMPIAKVDTEKRTVSGYASTPAKDSDGEIVTLDAVRSALPGYMDYGNIREMHALKAVGVAQEANVDTKGLFLTAKIVDDDAWAKCVEGVYKGFSIGGRKLAKTGNKITSIEMTEISVVDRPANPECKMSLAKSAKRVGEAQGYLLKIKPKVSTEGKALAKMAKIVTSLAKAGPAAAHDGFSLPAKPDANVSPKDPSVEVNKTDDDTTPCKEHGKINCEKCATAKANDGKVACKAHGTIDCEKCALEKREFDEKKRTELAASGKALPDGSYPIENVSDLENAVQAYGRAKDKGKAKAHIMARAKSLGAESTLPADWSGSKKNKKEAKKLAKAKLAAAFGIAGDSFLTLRKGMSTAGSLAYSFDSIRGAQRSLMMEAKREGGDMKDKALAGKLGTIAKDLASVISLKAEHEGGEALDMSDADDAYVTTLFGEEFQMAVNNGALASASTGDPIADAMALLMKRAAMPTRMQRMAMASDGVKKARKAAKDAREAIEDVHKMLKASYMAKMAKAAKKPDAKDDDDEFDTAGAMEKLQKAYAAINQSRDLGKAATAQLTKAMARSGQRGEEAGDAEAGFYEVPAGVTDLSPAALAGAAPGTKSGGSQPPMYPGDGSVYAGKAADPFDLRKYADKNGQVPAHVAELVMQNARATGELEALRRMPAAGPGGRRPYAFDMSKVVGGTTDNTAMNKALFDGVDVNAIGSGDERAHNEAAARTAGNFLMSGRFGKSLFDPEFRGMVGGGK